MESNHEKLQIAHKNDDSSKTRNPGKVDHVTDKDENCRVCRVCHCTESDRRGDAALDFLDIIPPLHDVSRNDINCSKDDDSSEAIKTNVSKSKSVKQPECVEFLSPDGEVFICKSDIEKGPLYHQDTLINLGCSCKGDLAISHYACALKWFVSHGSSVCEICECEAKNIKSHDVKKVISSMKEYELLRKRTASGDYAHTETNSGIDPDAVAAIRRQRLSEISMWFDPQIIATTIPQSSDQSLTNSPDNFIQSESPRNKWAVECTGILVASGLLTIILAWLIAPRVGKKTAKNGLHILLGGTCAFAVVIFLRFFVLSRIKYGPARYWAILFATWFLVFGVWASRTHGAHTT